VVELLNDDYARQIMTLVREDAKPARVLAEECGASRATVYRRLNRLQDAGLVGERLQYEEDGHHRKVFHLAVDSLSLTLDDSGLTASVS
jgi:DNA-binding Lrp family transcriptional regulator